ncbi:HAD family phosphatase [Clostridium bowmanii]|uniref:HAD family hydrolase n=1 Tax=Clostridium bowmanii TaxID=132925 RepID=UPI001C0C44BB|nr:HAD family phosphatase [Clostridium bowmanii]MBU3192043.1 HAD family phosphatase [Clostridium bowmanii]MCA1076283.1 HAD family phosphatase [Clostridium bowmanii]
MLKAVIFDMDGVIIDSEPTHMKLENETYKKLGIEVTDDEHHSFVGATSNYMWEALKNKYKLNQTLEELIEYDRNKYFKHLNSDECEIILIDGVKELIQDLYENGVKLAIASSSPLDVIYAIAKKFQIEEYFEAFVTGDYVKRSKPEPDIFIFAAEKLGVSAENCIVIEDSHNGVLAAKKAGMKCVGINSDPEGSQDISMADLVINKFKEVNYNKLNY